MRLPSTRLVPVGALRMAREDLRLRLFREPTLDEVLEWVAVRVPRGITDNDHRKAGS